MPGAVDWLPEAAFSDEAVKAALSDAVARWSARWFAHATASVTRVRRDTVPPPAQARLIEGALATAELSGPAKRNLLEAALDIDLAGRALSEGDHLVLDALAGRIAADMVALLDTQFKEAATTAPRLHLTLSFLGNEVLGVTLPRNALVPTLKAQLGSTARPQPVRSRREALASVRIVAHGVLGQAELALADVEGLAVGDVIVLEKSLQEPVELRLAGGQPIGRGKLSRCDGRAAIQF